MNPTDNSAYSNLPTSDISGDNVSSGSGLPSPVLGNDSIGVAASDNLNQNSGLNPAATNNAQSHPPMAQSSAPVDVKPSLDVQQQLGSSYSEHAPAIAEDADLIEKEWVNKAKSIVSKTRDNPSEQSKEINLFKADYLKKRYNKDIKVNES